MGSAHRDPLPSPPLPQLSPRGDGSQRSGTSPSPAPSSPQPNISAFFFFSLSFLIFIFCYFPAKPAADGEQRPRSHAQSRAATAASSAPKLSLRVGQVHGWVEPDRATLPHPLFPNASTASHLGTRRARTATSRASRSLLRPPPRPPAARPGPAPSLSPLAGSRCREEEAGDAVALWAWLPLLARAARSSAQREAERGVRAGRGEDKGLPWGDVQPRADTRHVLLDGVVMAE